MQVPGAPGQPLMGTPRLAPPPLPPDLSTALLASCPVPWPGSRGSSGFPVLSPESAEVFWKQPLSLGQWPLPACLESAVTSLSQPTAPHPCPGSQDPQVCPQPLHPLFLCQQPDPPPSLPDGKEDGSLAGPPAPSPSVDGEESTSGPVEPRVAP